MTCRQSKARVASERLELLPRFHPNAEMNGFVLEERPPHLPLRTFTVKSCILFIGVVLCVIGSYSIASLCMEPFVSGGYSLVGGVSSAVHNAIERANQEAKRNAEHHYEARERYMKRRRMSSNTHVQPAQSDEKFRRAPTTKIPPASYAPSSSVLSKMAALKSGDVNGLHSVNDEHISRLFPSWRSKQRQWNEDAVLTDLVSAVSELATFWIKDTEADPQKQQMYGTEDSTDDNADDSVAQVV
jgi:hypothetical protein